MNICPAPLVIEPDCIDAVDRSVFITRKETKLEFQRLREKYAR